MIDIPDKVNNVMPWKLGTRSERNLIHVHADLVKVVRHCLNISTCDFCVIEGIRTEARQRELVQAGHSRTMKSRHLTGHAVDIAPWIAGRIPWDDWATFQSLAQSMKTAAGELQIALIWGGDWATFKDGVHFELDKKQYP